MLVPRTEVWTRSPGSEVVEAASVRVHIVSLRAPRTVLLVQLGVVEMRVRDLHAVGVTEDGPSLRTRRELAGLAFRRKQTNSDRNDGDKDSDSSSSGEHLETQSGAAERMSRLAGRCFVPHKYASGEMSYQAVGIKTIGR